MMSKTDIIKREISSLARRMFSKGNGAVYLYGSRARGDASRNSDWDLLIVTDDTAGADDNFATYAFPFAEIGWHHGVQITPLHYTKSQWEAEKGTQFYLNVTSEAIML